LLDVNVLVALLDAYHGQHRAARTWLEAHVTEGWATCPITENGCLRVMTQPRYPSPAKYGDIARRLTRAVQQPSHAFWPDDVSVLDDEVFDTGRAYGPNQLSDIYLLALAVRHGGRLVTLDGGIVRSAVRGAEPHHLVVL
jgi:toxin-antitoxin system PIN domain toxin